MNNTAPQSASLLFLSSVQFLWFLPFFHPYLSHLSFGPSPNFFSYAVSHGNLQYEFLVGDSDTLQEKYFTEPILIYNTRTQRSIVIRLGLYLTNKT